jgi:hypothetical protein
MRTLLLAERPFRDLRSRALLADLPARLAAEEPLLIPSHAPNWPPGFAAVPPDADPATLGIARVLLASSYLDRPGFDRVLATARRAVAAGARLELRRVSLDGGAVRWPTAPVDIGVLDEAAVIELRDHATADALLVWRVAPPLRLSPYPERVGPVDPALAESLPEGPLLGLSMLGGARPRAAWQAHLPALRARLAPFAGWPVLPLPAEAPDSELDDLAGSRVFVDAVLPGAPVLLPALADPHWRRRELTLARLRGLVARCRLVVTSQDLPAAMAVGLGVPVFGLTTPPELRIAACLSTLANALPAGSDLVVLR